jgi:hypothetical protein
MEETRQPLILAILSICLITAFVVAVQSEALRTLSVILFVLGGVGLWRELSLTRPTTAEQDDPDPVTDRESPSVV